MRNIAISVISSIALAMCSTAFSDTEHSTMVNRVVDGSYIVTFKPHEGGGSPMVLPPNALNRGKVPVGQPTSGQDRRSIEAKLALRGTVASIFENSNSAHIMMDAEEADRLSRHPQVLRVDQDGYSTTAATQQTPSNWALDRMDEHQPIRDFTYEYQFTGAGRTIYILDTGLTLSNSTVAAEFGGRASIFNDVNEGGDGSDCDNHGTAVASASGGNSYGIAKEVTLRISKITDGCTNSAKYSSSMEMFDWLASNAPPGTIVNWSHVVSANNCGVGILYPPLENAIISAHNAGLIIVVAAGNDGCDTGHYTPTRLSQAFVVGSTGTSQFPTGDAKATSSRTGWNVSGFAPGHHVTLMNKDGFAVPLFDGTSFAAPYVAGIFAVACQAAGQFCNSGNTPAIYQAMRDTATLNTVTNPDGSPLTGATSRFIGQHW